MPQSGRGARINVSDRYDNRRREGIWLRLTGSLGLGRIVALGLVRRATQAVETAGVKPDIGQQRVD